MLKYKIKIEKVEDVQTFIPNPEPEWKKLREPYPFEKELNTWLSEADKEKQKTDPQNAYVSKPGYTKTEIVTTVLLEQTTDTLNLVEVIKAINNIKSAELPNKPDAIPAYRSA